MFLHETLQDPWWSILYHAVIWFLLGVWVFSFCRRSRYGTIGLPICYLVLMAILHAGALIYLLPWYDPNKDAYIRSQGLNIVDVSAGFALSTFAVLGFSAGVLTSESLYKVRMRPMRLRVDSVRRFGRTLVAIGIVSFFVILPVAGKIPSGTAIASSAVNLSVVGLCLLGYNSLREQGGAKLRVLAGTLALPASTILFMGFVGFGVTALLSVVSYVISFQRIRAWHLPVALFVFWLALSFYVTYVDARAAIRESVWGGDSISQRINVVAEKFSKGMTFDPYNSKHLHFIDGRLNQNILVGRCISYMRTTNKDFSYGQSIYFAAVAWIPRIIWPNKPSFGGSGSLVSEHTGMIFGEGTAVGAGQVLEFYANFGVTGVFLGFLVFGIALRQLDVRAVSHLRSGDYFDYVRFHLMGVCAMQPGGVLAEIVASCAAAWLLMICARYYLKSRNIAGDVTAPLAQRRGQLHRT
jgi:hypothetical protein